MTPPDSLHGHDTLHRHDTLIGDIAAGTSPMLRPKALCKGVTVEQLNALSPETVRLHHRTCLEAGSRLILADTFSVPSLPESEGLPLMRLGVENALAAAAGLRQPVAVGVRLGAVPPHIDPETAFRRTLAAAREGVAAGADILYLETIYSPDTLATAFRVASHLHPSIPGNVMVALSLTPLSETLFSSFTAAARDAAQNCHISAVGLNCIPPTAAATWQLRQLHAATELPLMFYPSASVSAASAPLPPDEWASAIDRVISPIRSTVPLLAVGGCCATTPSHIQALSDLLQRR